MGLPVEVNPLFLENQYAIQRSLRFRSSVTAYLNRTFGTPTNEKIWTWSAWVKRGKLGAFQTLFSASTGASPAYDGFRFTDTDTLQFFTAGAVTVNLQTTAVYRDPSSWYHIVLSYNATTTSVVLYVNGVQQTLTGTTVSNTTYSFNRASTPHAMQVQVINNGYTNFPDDGYLAEVNFIDGQALLPTAFGQYNEFGVWSPRKYSGSYGTNGFYLPFTDTSALTSSLTGNVGLGRDFSGNSNYWITNNISIAGSSYTSYTSGSGTYTVPAGITSINYLVVGGGGGGAYFGGGGGGGGVLAGQLSVTPGQTISYSVGGGGNGSTSNGTDGTNGTSSTFGSVTALGGGGGGSSTTNGVAGGSGGGGSRLGTGGAGTTGQGFAGGNGTTNGSTYFNAGGGGGATAVGGNAIAVAGNTQGGGTGGAGYTWINGSVYGGGGGGGGYGANGGPGGSGGGGSGGGDFNTNTAGTANTGGGGGGGKSGGSGSNGGSGIIIISIGGATTYDAMTDVPPPSTIQNVAAGNYAVMNPLSNPIGAIFTLSDGNLSYSCSASSGNAPKMTANATMALGSGKFYWEMIPTNTNPVLGVASELTFSSPYGAAYASVYNTSQQQTAGITYSGTTFTFIANDIIGFAWDGTALTMACYKNNVLIGTFSGFSSTTNYFPHIEANSSASATTAVVNFGQRPFSYTPPSGFRPLNSNNLPMPTIPNGAKVMAAVTYSGNNGTQPISSTSTNSGNNPLSTTFQPDLVWIKSRTSTDWNGFFDAVRTAGKVIWSNSTSVEVTNDVNGYLSAFNASGSNGFTVTAGSSTAAGVNATGNNYVAWQWNAGGAPTPNNNTDGSITSTVSVNKSAGFSIVTYTGTAANATVGHGLGVAPSMIITKRRTTFTSGWGVWHTALAATEYLLLNTTDAKLTAATAWNSTLPTSTVFSVGNASFCNGSVDAYVCYAWTPIAGYSSMGSYTGNGSTDGPMIFTGMRPRFLMIKRTDAVGNWVIQDTSRSTYNQSQANLYPNLSNAEDTTTSYFDILSNGFKLRQVENNTNNSGGTYIYLAFAENPFKLALAR